MAFVQTPIQFYAARFLLGVLEAGFFPGIILYLTYWYPSARRGQIIAMFMTATAIASVIAGPLSGATMKYFNDIDGWHGWQWLFISQGLPASILGLIAYFYLQDKPEDAKWLSAEEKTALRFQLDHDHKDVETASHAGFFQMLKDPKVYGLAFTYFLLLGATYTMVFWIPSLIKSWGVADLFQVGLLATLPQIAGIIGTILMGRHSDKTRERRWHYATCVAVAAVRPFGHNIFPRQFAGVDHRPDARRPWLHFGDAAVLHDNHRIPFQGKRGRRHRADQQPRQSRPGCGAIRHGLYYSDNRQLTLQHISYRGSLCAIRPAAAG